MTLTVDTRTGALTPESQEELLGQLILSEQTAGSHDAAKLARFMVVARTEMATGMVPGWGGLFGRWNYWLANAE